MSWFPKNKELKHQLLEHPQYQFHLWQLGFWVFMSIVSFFTLTLWYGDVKWVYILHMLVQALLGYGFSLCMHWYFLKLWVKPIPTRISLSLLTIILFSFVWTLLRIEIFVQLTNETGIWADFGGWYYSAIFIFLSWAGMFYGIRYFQIQQDEHEEMLKVEAEARGEQVQRIWAQIRARNAQIKMLRYQLNPHFLCNTLNAINALVEIQETEKAQKMTVKLSEFLRYSLDNNPDAKVALEKEIFALNLYLDIEKARFGDRLKVVYEVSEEAKYANVPSLLLQPIIENSMKHAISKNEDGGTITIKAKVDDWRLILELSDSGDGGKVEASKLNSFTGRGVGLRNTDERLETLYNKQYRFDISLQDAGGLKTCIEIPYQISDARRQQLAGEANSEHIA